MEGHGARNRTRRPTAHRPGKPLFRPLTSAAMSQDASPPARVPGRDQRSNGLASDAPGGGQTILVTGGGGYIGCVLVGRLLERGHRVRVLDRLYWGEQPLADVRDRIELVVADIRELPPTALDDVDAVIHLAGLSNDP